MADLRSVDCVFLPEEKSNVCFLLAADQFASSDGLCWHGIRFRTFHLHWETSSDLGRGCRSQLISIPSSSNAVSLRSTSVLEVTLFPLRLRQSWHDPGKLLLTLCPLLPVEVNSMSRAVGCISQCLGGTSQGLCLLKIRAFEPDVPLLHSAFMKYCCWQAHRLALGT